VTIIFTYHRTAAKNLGGEYLSLSLGFPLQLTIQLEGGELHKRSGGYEPNLLRRETNLEGGKWREFSRLGSRQWTLSQKLQPSLPLAFNILLGFCNSLLNESSQWT
jgi:hypothetical protein